MGIFRLKMGKNYCDIWKSILEFAEMQKIVRNKKTSNLGPKCLIRYFGL